MIESPGQACTEGIIPNVGSLNAKAPIFFRLRDGIPTQKMEFSFFSGGSPDKVPLNLINLREDSTRKGGELHGMGGDAVKGRLSKGYAASHAKKIGLLAS